MLQSDLLQPQGISAPKRFTTQLLKWVGNKQRFAHEIAAYFPTNYGTYHEPFLGSGAVLGTVAPPRAKASDACAPLIDIWKLVHGDPDRLADSYRERWHAFMSDRVGTYERVRDQFNRKHNPEDLFFLARTCYAGIIRFRTDGYMSTPIGPHRPVSPDSVAHRIELWAERTRGASFTCQDFESALHAAQSGDLVYCDPPYSDTQAILYGAQAFSLSRLFRAIQNAKQRGVRVALSIDGRKKSGRKSVQVNAPPGLFETECSIACGRSMLRRLQMSGMTLESEEVTDRLLLTWSL